MALRFRTKRGPSFLSKKELNVIRAVGREASIYAMISAKGVSEYEENKRDSHSDDQAFRRL